MSRSTLSHDSSSFWNSYTSRQILPKNRDAPSTPCSLHSRSSLRRRRKQYEEPCRCPRRRYPTFPQGLTIFPLDLDILAPSFKTMPWGKQAGKRLLGLDESDIREEHSKEPGIHEMQDSMLDSAGVLIHRQPIIGCIRIPGFIVRPRTGESNEIPR